MDTLQSVFAQTFCDYEVIVIDNASTDNTRQLLEPLIQEEKLKYILHDKNYERAKSRNTGQRVARGKFVTFLDSDDFMYPDNLKDAHLFAGTHPTMKFFHNLYELVNDEREVVYKFSFNPLKDPVKQICEGNFLSCIGVFIHRDIYSTLFWDEEKSLTGSEDYEFWIRVIAHEKMVGRINKINSGILHHPGRTMNNLQLETTERRYEYILSKIASDEKLMVVYEPHLTRLRGFRWLFLAGLAREFSSKMMLVYLKRAIQTFPPSFFSKAFLYNIFFLIRKQFLFRDNRDH